MRYYLLCGLLLLFSPNIYAQSGDEARTMGWIALATSTGLTAAAWDWRYDCKKGFDYYIGPNYGMVTYRFW